MKLKRRLNFEADEVRRVIQKSLAILTPRVEPGTPNNDEQRMGLADLFIYYIGEVGSERDGIHIHEYMVGSELIPQQISNSSRLGGIALSPVADKYPGPRRPQSHC